MADHELLGQIGKGETGTIGGILLTSTKGLSLLLLGELLELSPGSIVPDQVRILGVQGKELEHLGGVVKGQLPAEVVGDHGFQGGLDRGVRRGAQVAWQVTSQPGQGTAGKSGAVVGSFLFIGFDVGLHTALVEGVIVTEQEEDEVPETPAFDQLFVE